MRRRQLSNEALAFLLEDLRSGVLTPRAQQMKRENDDLHKQYEADYALYLASLK